MYLLEMNDIAIDNWISLFPEKTTFLLTHVHTDHAHIPKHFQYSVYTSTVSARLYEHKALVPILEPYTWYTTNGRGLPFQVFNTNHSVESIGFYFPTLDLMYIGDGIDHIAPLYAPMFIIYDNVYEHIDKETMTKTQTCALLHHILTRICHIVTVVHHGILSYLSHCTTLKFRIHASVTDTVRRAAEYLGMIDDTSMFTMVGRSYDESMRIVPSSLWFMIRDDRLCTTVYTDNNKIRIFCPLHALKCDIQKLINKYPYAYMEPMLTDVKKIVYTHV